MERQTNSKPVTKEEIAERFKKYPRQLAGYTLCGIRYYCVCGKEVFGFKDQLSAQEFRISRLCQECQDSVFTEEDGG